MTETGDSTVTVVSHPTRGRGLFATEAIASGQELLVSEPLAAVLDPPLWATHCAACFARASASASPVACRGCGLVRFCSEQCRDDCLRHRSECATLPALARRLQAAGPEVWRGGEAMTDALLTAVLLRARHLATNSAARDATALSSPLQLAGMAVADCLERPKMRPYASAAKAIVAASLETLQRAGSGGTKPLIPEALLNNVAKAVPEVSDMLLRVSLNCHTITSPRWERLGRGVYPDGALINHDCNPNVQLHYDTPGGLAQSVRALRPIAAGEELSMCYCDPAAPTWARRARLLSSHWFECACSRCKSESTAKLPRNCELIGDVEGIPLSCCAELALGGSGSVDPAWLESGSKAGSSKAEKARRAKNERLVSDALSDLTGLLSGLQQEAAETSVCGVHQCRGLLTVPSEEAESRLRLLLGHLRTLESNLHPNNLSLFGARLNVFWVAEAAKSWDIVLEVGQHLLGSFKHLYDAVLLHPQSEHCNYPPRRGIVLLSMARALTQAQASRLVSAVPSSQELAAAAWLILSATQFHGHKAYLALEACSMMNVTGVGSVECETSREVVNECAADPEPFTVTWTHPSDGHAVGEVMFPSALADVEIDLSKTELVLSRDGQVLQKIPLPFESNPDLAEAKWVRRAGKLKVKVFAIS